MHNAHKWRLVSLYTLFFLCVAALTSALYLIVFETADQRAAWSYETGNAYMDFLKESPDLPLQEQQQATHSAYNAYRDAVRYAPLESTYRDALNNIQKPEQFK